MTAQAATPPRPAARSAGAYRLWLALLSGMLLAGVIGAYFTLRYGLVVTNLTDQVPWGLWITLDLSAIALGAGAFTFSAVVYLFRLRRYEPVARMAVFIGFLGYSSAMLALALDIGRPDRFWHPLVFWNVHSVLWEITWCVVLYFTILAVEFAPTLVDSQLFDNRPRLRRLGHGLHRFTPVAAVLGLILSLLHQSSLGATYGVLSGRAIWFKPSLPVMFILSAVAGGTALTLLATMISSRLLGRRLISDDLQRGMARLSGFALLAYLYLKLWDWAATSYYANSPGTADALARLQVTSPYQHTFWWLEVLLAGVVPAVILLTARLRRNDRLLMLALALVAVGVVVNRWNVTLSGLVAPPHWSPGVLGQVIAVAYFPSWAEVAVAAGIVGYALLAFTLGVRHLPLFPETERS
jgi:molybdopterin-containing oxidoreductase family membrane subunit